MADGLRLTQLTRKLEYAAKADLFYVVSSTGTGISRSYRISLDNIGKGIKFNVLKPDFDKIESNWNTTYAFSGNWQNAYTTTNANSARWSSVYTTTNSCSAKWDSVYTTTNSCSAKWDSVYTTTYACSAKWDSVLTYDKIYPIGSIYISTLDSNPGYVFSGTTWIAYGQGRVLLGAGQGIDINGKSITFAGGACGGEYCHILSVNEMPAHTHTFAQREIVNDAAEVCGGENITVNGNDRITERTGSTGGNLPHNNIQPYITVYMWLRTG